MSTDVQIQGDPSDCKHHPSRRVLDVNRFLHRSIAACTAVVGHSARKPIRFSRIIGMTEVNFVVCIENLHVSSTIKLYRRLTG